MKWGINVPFFRMHCVSKNAWLSRAFSPSTVRDRPKGTRRAFFSGRIIFLFFSSFIFFALFPCRTECLIRKSSVLSVVLNCLRRYGNISMLSNGYVCDIFFLLLLFWGDSCFGFWLFSLAQSSACEKTEWMRREMLPSLLLDIFGCIDQCSQNDYAQIFSSNCSVHTFWFHIDARLLRQRYERRW